MTATDRNANRPGYKKTPVGWIPEEWECRTGQEITHTISKGSSPKWQGFDYATSGMLFVTSENVREGYLDVSDPKFLPLAFHAKMKRTQLRRNDILINLVGASIGRSCLVDRDLGAANINQAVAVFRVKDTVQTKYAAHYLQTPDAVARILGMQVDAARPNISLTNLREFNIPLPPLPEQKKIADILATWDEAIEDNRALIAAAKRRKKSLMQQLLTGKQRFRRRAPDTKRRITPLGLLPADWPLKNLGEAFVKVSRKNATGVTRVLTASGHDGLVDQRSFFNKTVAAENTSGYYLLKRGEFAYNRSAMNGYPYGAIKRLEKHEDGVLSTLYTCFALRDPACDSDFYVHLFEIGMLERQLRCITHVGGRAHGLLNVTDSDFFAIRVPVPPLTEQRAIAAVLTTADAEIKSLEAKCAALERQKKGLMQKLLTGEVRVRLFAEAGQ